MIYKNSVVYLLVALILLLGFIPASRAVSDDFCSGQNMYDEKGEKILTQYEHKQKYGMNGGHTYTKDEGYWVYTSSFRERFGMPCDWVDNDLKGAEGVSLWLARSTRGRYHSTEGGDEKCVPSRQWNMKLYIGPQYDLGFTGNYMANSRPGFSSLTQLAKKNPNLKKRWDELFDLHNVQMFLKSSTGDILQEIKVEPSWYAKEYSVYDLTSVLLLINDEFFLDDPNHMYVIEFKDSSGNIVHSIEIPVSYWQRAAKYPEKLADISKENWAGGREVGDYLWIYTKEFAEKYSMPESNISEELEGAMALAFRVNHYGTVTCGFFGKGENPGSCAEDTKRQLDVYLPEDARLYFNNDKYQWENKFGIGSSLFIRSKDRDPKRDDAYYENLTTQFQRVISISRTRERKYFGLIPTEKFRGWSSESLHLGSYYRLGSLTDSFTYLQINSMSIWDRDEHYLVFTDSENVMAYTRPKLYESEFHKVKIPLSYRKKILAYIEDFENSNGSLWQLVEKRIQSK